MKEDKIKVGEKYGNIKIPKVRYKVIETIVEYLHIRHNIININKDMHKMSHIPNLQAHIDHITTNILLITTLKIDININRGSNIHNKNISNNNHIMIIGVMLLAMIIHQDIKL
jgi:hypothetical protein